MFPWEKESKLENTEKDKSKAKEKAARWYRRHSEQAKANAKKFDQENPEYHQNWRKDNPDKVKEYSERQNDSEERKAYMREYMKDYYKQEEAKEKRKEYMREYMRKKRAAEKKSKKKNDE